MNRTLTISIIIPAFNEAKLIAGTLRHIQSAMTPFTNIGWLTELIVCDNNSTDSTGGLARQSGAKVVHEPINQIGRARNSGAAAASGDWLIFVDADSTPGQELFADVAIQIQSGRCMAGGSTVQFDRYSPISALGIGFWNCLSRTMKLFAGSFIFCETAAFREIGGFSGELYAGEEIDLCRRLKKRARAKGKTIVILHRHPLLTSSRKLRLYSWRDYFRLFARSILTRGKALKSRDDCFPWYDGRR